MRLGMQPHSCLPVRPTSPVKSSISTADATWYKRKDLIMDRIIIKDLLIRGIIGISERERSQRQDILVNIVLFGDISAAGKSDNIQDCINYRTVARSEE